MAGKHGGGNAKQEDWDPDKHGGGNGEPASDGSTPQGSGDHRKDDNK
ncbi:hypothetical protein [Streptomyces telluris]|uniref:Uncharacterized protein n=1 Tax=Streptomyces telluris TaxID=2720021 RepID=A0A9X2LPJ3_9ACTN|nr:hypothetical protein [Streptomyces telluris]MCQ8774804.1 hypothetical protein [Streptomyces telluris]